MIFALQGRRSSRPEVMVGLRHLFKIKSEEVAEFQCIGLNIKKNRDNVKLWTEMNIKKIKM